MCSGKGKVPLNQMKYCSCLQTDIMDHCNFYLATEDLRLWICLQLWVFSTPAVWGWAMSNAAPQPRPVLLWLETQAVLRPRCWQISSSNTSSRSLVPWTWVNLAIFSPVSGAYWRNVACPCSGFQLVSDAASCRSYFYNADGFIFCGLEWAFLSFELHEPPFTGI